MRPTLPRLVLLLAPLLAGCPKSGGGPPVTLTAETLSLPPVPAVIGQVEVEAAHRKGQSPARVTVLSEKNPLKLRLEDFDQGEIFEVVLEAEGDPATFGQAPGTVAPDTGKALRSGGRLDLDLARQEPTGSSRLAIHIDRAPIPSPPPAGWLAPGTVLFYGLTLDDKPITKEIPMALTVRLGAGSDGSRVLTWKADIDPLAQKVVTGERSKSGRRVVPAAVVQSGSRLDDRFGRGDDVPDANSLFLSRSQLQGVKNLGGAALQDVEIGSAGVLVRGLALNVPVQADAELWSVPAVAAWAYGGDAVYVVADDDENPLLLSVSRPGATLRLMAIGRPARRD